MKKKIKVTLIKPVLNEKKDIYYEKGEEAEIVKYSGENFYKLRFKDGSVVKAVHKDKFIVDG